VAQIDAPHLSQTRAAETRQDLVRGGLALDPGQPSKHIDRHQWADLERPERSDGPRMQPPDDVVGSTCHGPCCSSPSDVGEAGSLAESIGDFAGRRRDRPVGFAGRWPARPVPRLLDLRGFLGSGTSLPVTVRSAAG
jgi:hypothetical protein